VVRRTRNEGAHPGGELLGRQAIEEVREGNGDAFEPDGRDSRLVTAEQGGELGALAACGVVGDVAA
jgi:hypothetical protein